jgi:hypothetical protein
MKHKLNSKGQAGTTVDACKIAENIMSSQPIANAIVGCSPLLFAFVNINYKLKIFVNHLVL